MKQKKEISLKALIAWILLFALIIVLVLPKEILQKRSLTGAALSTVRVLSAFPPTFDFNFTNQTIYENSNFVLDVNCSDLDSLDTITYSDNFSGFEINGSTGLINKTGFTESNVGNNTISISCFDGKFNTSQIFSLEILNVNDPPVLSAIGPQIATEGSLFTLDVDAFDPDPDNINLTYYASTSLFTIDSVTGLINFTPELSQVGNYTINISVFDGEFYDYEIVSFSIVRGPFCGDSSCGSIESCSSCPIDCNACPIPPPNPEAVTQEEGGGGGESGGVVEVSPALGGGRAPYERCDEKWECSSWTVCSIEGIKTRKCRDVNNCNAKNKKPIELDKCSYQTTCNDGIRNGNEDGVDCGGGCQPCLVPNCFDRIQNQGEEDVDCAGPCSPCEIKKFAKVPFIDFPTVFKIPKKFPWMWLLLLFGLITLIAGGDQIHVRHISRKKFEDYRESEKKYRILRRRLHKLVAVFCINGAVVISYAYMFSNDSAGMKKFLWIPAVLCIAAPIIVSFATRRYVYYEYRKKEKERRLQTTHRRELLQLMDVENRLLAEAESKEKDDIYQIATQQKFDGYPALFNEMNPVYGLLSSLQKIRNRRMELSRINSQTYKKISAAIENGQLAKLSKEFSEFISIKKTLEDIQDNINLDTHDREQEFVAQVREISKPYMISLIKSDERIVALYNRLVDIYDIFMQKHGELQQNEQEIAKFERQLSEKIKDMTKKAKVMDSVQKNPVFASVYNGFVDLFNHYTKKQELRTKIEKI